ncbi:hypothetical protein ABPG72_008342, partial [Tetrahymena utriculariae]
MESEITKFGYSDIKKQKIIRKILYGSKALIKENNRKAWEDDLQNDMQEESTSTKYNYFINMIAKIINQIPYEVVNSSWNQYLKPVPSQFQINNDQTEEGYEKLQNLGQWASDDYECILYDEINEENKDDIILPGDIDNNDQEDEVDLQFEEENNLEEEEIE